MSHCLLFVLAFMGVLLVRVDGASESHLLSLLFLSSLVFFLSDETTKPRLLYNIPLGLFSSVALALLIGVAVYPCVSSFFFNSLFYLFMSLNALVWFITFLGGLMIYVYFYGCYSSLTFTIFYVTYVL